MSNIIRSVSPRVSYIASEHTWIEGKAIQQLETTANLPDMVQVTGMPDLHPGRGYPVGAAFFSQHRFYPALIGNDIGCGMSVWLTDLAVAKQSLDKLEKRLGNIDGPLEEHLLADIPAEFSHCYSLGTIGGGNHFAEFLQIDEIFTPFSALDKKRLILLVHSGSQRFTWIRSGYSGSSYSRVRTSRAGAGFAGIRRLFEPASTRAGFCRLQSPLYCSQNNGTPAYRWTAVA